MLLPLCITLIRVVSITYRKASVFNINISTNSKNTKSLYNGRRFIADCVFKQFLINFVYVLVPNNSSVQHNYNKQ